MPKLIKNGELMEDAWQPLNPEAVEPESNRVLSLGQWQALKHKSGSAVQLEPGEGIADIKSALQDIAVVAINFPAFADGRGFSYARELRELGYEGEIRAVGHFIRDQLAYLQRCGFNAFQFADDAQYDEAVAGLTGFTEHYQGAIDQPLPLFRRR